jgi:hypothetical protein
VRAVFSWSCQALSGDAAGLFGLHPAPDLTTEEAASLAGNSPGCWRCSPQRGDAGAARRAWAQALRILGEIDHADAGHVRAKLCSPLSPGPAMA